MYVCLMDDGFICKLSSLASRLHVNERRRGRVTLVRPDKACRAAHEIFRLCACGLTCAHARAHTLSLLPPNNF